MIEFGDPTWLQTTWFILVGVLFAGYVILDGFDLGVGSLHLFTKSDEDRRLMLNSIGPVWDGNEVWLVTGGGALFAAFPEVYATVFSGFYLAFMLLLFGLIFRAVAIEFRSKEEWGWWRRMWDWGFAVGSTLSALLIGVAMGNIAWGVPLDAEHEFAGTFFGLLHPYALLLGVTTVALFMMHGNIYVILKTEGALQEKARRWIKWTIPAFVGLFLVFNGATLTFVEQVRANLQEHPIILSVLFVASLLAVFNIPREIHHGREWRGFLSSCTAMVMLLALFAVSVFPVMVYSSPNPEHSLTVINGSSTELTLKNMLIVAIIGMPIVLAYTVSIYWIFRGKVKIGKESY